MELGEMKSFLQLARFLDSTLMIGLVLGEVFRDNRDNGTGWLEFQTFRKVPDTLEESFVPTS